MTTKNKLPARLRALADFIEEHEIGFAPTLSGTDTDTTWHCNNTYSGRDGEADARHLLAALAIPKSKWKQIDYHSFIGISAVHPDLGPVSLFVSRTGEAAPPPVARDAIAELVP